MSDFRKEFSKYRHRIRMKKQEIKQKAEDIEKFRQNANERKRKHEQMKKAEDEDKFRQNAADRKRKQEEIQRLEDEKKFRRNANERKRKHDQMKKTEDEGKFRKNANERKRKQEEKQKAEDEEKFRRNANERIRKHQQKQKTEDEVKFRRKANENIRKTETKKRGKDLRRFKEDTCLRRRNADSNVSADKRIANFRKRVKYGPIFVCSSCHQKLFSHQVEKMTETLKDVIDAVDPEIRGQYIDEEILVDLGQDKDGNENKYPYICKSCKNYLKKGKLPKLSTYNGLGIDSLGDPEIKLSELENNLIATNIIFQKIHKLPKSRWSGTHDRLVNVPVGPQDVLNTIESLPRTPAEAGIIPIIPVKLKRKLEYKTTHLVQMIDTTKIFKYLEYLRKMGHPSYKFYDDWNVYKQRCLDQDPTGCKLVFPEAEDEIMDLEEYLDENKKK